MSATRRIAVALVSLVTSHGALAQLRMAGSESEERGSVAPPQLGSLAPAPATVDNSVTMSLQVTMLSVVFLLLLCLGACCGIHALCRRYACCAFARGDADSFDVLGSASRSRNGSTFREDLLNDDELLRLWICWYCDFANYEMKLQCALCGNNKKQKDLSHSSSRKPSAVRPASLLAVSSSSFAATTGLSFSSSSSSSCSSRPSSSPLPTGAASALSPSPSTASPSSPSTYFTPSFLAYRPLETLPESPSTNNSAYTLSTPPGHEVQQQYQQQLESFSGSRRRREWRTRLKDDNQVVWSWNTELLAVAATLGPLHSNETAASKRHSQETPLGATTRSFNSPASFSSLLESRPSLKTTDSIAQATAFVSRLSVPSSTTTSSPTTRYQHPHGVLRLEPAENARVYAVLEAQYTDPSSLSCGVGPHAVESVRALSFPEKHRWFIQETSALLNVRWDSPGLTSDTTLLVSRDDLLGSSVHGLMRISQKQLRRPLRVRFANEPGIDAGGVVREWIGLAVTEGLEDATGLFQCVHSSDDGLAYTISQNASLAVEAHLLHLRAFGRLLGKALLEGHLVAAPLTDVMFKHVLGAPISFADLQAADPKLAHSLQLLWDTPLTDGDPESGDGDGDDPAALATMADDDLEAELMDLASNEHAYLPPQPQATPRRSSFSAAASQQPENHMLHAAVEQRHERQQQARERFSFSGSTSSSSSLSASGLAASLASSLGIRGAGDGRGASTELEEQRRRMQTAFNEIASLRQQQIVERVGAPSAQPPPLTWNPNTDAMTQMVGKLDAVVDASLKELQAPTRAAALWTQVLQDLPPEETDYLAKAADEKFEQQIKYCKSEREVQQCVERHLSAILIASVPTRHGQNMAKTMKHSLGQLLRGFRGVFLACYEHLVAQCSVDQVALVLPLVSTDVLQFASILVQLLLFKYPFAARYKEHVRRCVIAVLFELLQPTLHGIYVGAFRTEDAVMEDIAGLKRMNPPADFGIAPIFRLDGGADHPEASRQHAMHQFGASIYRLNNLVNIRSPWVKVQALVLVCRDIDAAIKGYYTQQPVKPAPEEININADALRAILAFVLVSSPSMCLHVFSQLAILSSFLPDAFVSSEEGFALATFTAAVRLVARLP
ncbi:hypothetical protein PybrP1_012949 [[Pythium] brassicae (nom. inval.)]|nr:hypothetical protein PybrP1_012949 [[Pythium] brassicae (nom. inval.)]